MTISRIAVVASCAPEEVPITIHYGGRELVAMAQGLCVELHDDNDGQTHGQTHRFVPAGPEAMAEHLAVFQPGAKVLVTFAAAPATEA